MKKRSPRPRRAAVPGLVAVTRNSGRGQGQVSPSEKESIATPTSVRTLARTAEDQLP